MSLRSLLKSNNSLLYLAAFVYNILHLSYPLRYIITGRVKCPGVFLKKTSFNIKGKGSRIEIGNGTRLRECSIMLHGTRCYVSIGGGRLVNTSLYLEDDRSSIKIGYNFSIESGHIASTEGQSIIIGDDCMFSNDIEIRNGDSHAIIDMENGLRTNKAQTVTIGNHVWLTAHCRVLKGSYIPDDCIIGNSAIVAGCLKKSHAIYGGSPLRILKENKTWDRSRYKETY